MALGAPAIERKLTRKPAAHTKAAANAFAAFNRQKLKSERERTERFRLENAITRAEYLKRSEIAKRLATVADAIVSRITAADLPRSVKEEVLKDIASIPLIFEEAAYAQSRHAAVAKTKKADAKETSANDDSES